MAKDEKSDDGRHDDDDLWSDDDSPVDVVDVDDAEGDEDGWDDYDESSPGMHAEGGAPVRHKKKGTLTNILIIGAGLVLGLGVLYAQVSGGGKQGGSGAAGETASVADDDGGPPLPQVVEEPPMPAPITTETAEEEPLTPLPDEMPAVPVETASPSPIAVPGDDFLEMPEMEAPVETEDDLAAVDDAMQPREAPPLLPKAQDIVLPPQPEPEEEEPVSGEETSSMPLIDAAPLQPVETEARPAPVAAMETTGDEEPAAKAEDVARLEEGIGEIDQKIEDLYGRLAAMEKLLVERTGEKSEPVERDDEALAALQGELAALKSKVSDLSLSARSGSGGKQAKPVGGGTEEKVKKPAAVKSSGGGSPYNQAWKPANAGWVLKSARPGQAMVSKPGDDAVYTVKVGETLAGVGNITSIGQENGRWVVRGTMGQVAQ